MGDLGEGGTCVSTLDAHLHSVTGRAQFLRQQDKDNEGGRATVTEFRLWQRDSIGRGRQSHLNHICESQSNHFSKSYIGDYIKILNISIQVS